MKKIFIIILFLAGLFFYYLLTDSAFPNNATVTKLIVYKSKRKLIAYSNEKILKQYTISLGDDPIGHKQKEGDEKTPEGTYFINDKRGLGQSVCYKNLGISYPNKKDIANAKRNGYSPGGNIKIHGLPNGLGCLGRLHRWMDWTNGCIAITNKEMDELFEHVNIRTPIIILP